jgi:hypothetical protein
MGEAKRRQYSRREFLGAHRWCAYCGAQATTTDHCPPRSFFLRRIWPETYEFPACSPCNEDGRQIEQVLAVLVRIGLKQDRPEIDKGEWERLVRGVRNNQPEIHAEWMSMTENRRKHSMREAFGPDGDLMRRDGWGSINIGELTQAMIARFIEKLGKALYYRHNGRPFEGVIYASHFNSLSKAHPPQLMDSILGIAPIVSEAKRASQELSDQFIYRFNHSPEHGIIYAVVHFNPQMIFQVIAVGWDMEARIVEMTKDNGMTPPFQRRFACHLKQNLTVKQHTGDG